jgi:hypothetical protein
MRMVHDNHAHIEATSLDLTIDEGASETSAVEHGLVD